MKIYEYVTNKFIRHIFLECLNFHNVRNDNLRNLCVWFITHVLLIDDANSVVSFQDLETVSSKWL